MTTTQMTTRCRDAAPPPMTTASAGRRHRATSLSPPSSRPPRWGASWLLALSLGWVAAACSDDAANDGGGQGAGTDAVDTADAPDNADAASAHPSLAWALQTAGPHGVGYRKLEVSYEAGGGLGTRKIPLHLFYPTAATQGSHPPPHGGLVVDNTSWVDAPATPPDDGVEWPVMVYSHGHQGFAGSSAFLAWHFASHGWIVAAPDHVGNLLSDAILPRPTWMYYARNLDVGASLDRVAKLGAADGFGGGKADTSRVVLTGHSFGAHTCWAAAGASFDIKLMEADCKEDGARVRQGDCSPAMMALMAAGLRDERIVAAIPLAGTMHRGVMGDKGHETAKIPVLSITGTKDDVGGKAQFDSCVGCDLTWIDLLDGTHQSFAVTCSQPGSKDKTCPDIKRYTLAMARRHVLGDQSVKGLLAGEGKSDVVVKFEQRKP